MPRSGRCLSALVSSCQATWRLGRRLGRRIEEVAAVRANDTGTGGVSSASIPCLGPTAWLDSAVAEARQVFERRHKNTTGRNRSSSRRWIKTKKRKPHLGRRRRDNIRVQCDPAKPDRPGAVRWHSGSPTMEEPGRHGKSSHGPFLGAIAVVLYSSRSATSLARFSACDCVASACQLDTLRTASAHLLRNYMLDN